MASIEQYTGELLLDFLDASHAQIKSELEKAHGDDWFSRGVEAHVASEYFERVRTMLNSPMRVVDMDRADEELYGVEHIENLVLGNWDCFEKGFGDRARTSVYCREVAEMRNNLFHRRHQHRLGRHALVRFVANGRMLLSAFGSPEAKKFEAIEDVLLSGGTPWGPPLVGNLPSREEYVDEFVGRPQHLEDLRDWLASDVRQMVLWGYGGTGKSAIAYQFATEVAEASPDDLLAIGWVTAKSEEYVEGAPRPRKADFVDLTSFVEAAWTSIVGTEPPDGLDAATLSRELSAIPSLLIIDDLDTVLEDQELLEYLLHELRSTDTRVLYTSRHQIAGLRRIDVPAFDADELEQFVRVRAPVHDMAVDECLARLEAIGSVTESYPLYVDDLLRYARLGGLHQAIDDWSQKKGDAARSYALRRQLESLAPAATHSLIAMAVAGRPVTAVEIATIGGTSDGDVEHEVTDLLSWKLIHREASEEEGGRPAFGMNRNTARLVLKTYSGDTRVDGFRAALRSTTGESTPSAMRYAVGSAVSLAKTLVVRGDIDGAVEALEAAMTGDLANSSDLFGVLGWVNSRDPFSRAEQARAAFIVAKRLGTTKQDTFFHWASMERAIAESEVGRVDDEELLALWERFREVADDGIERCGASLSLCNLSGYAHSRTARTLQHLNRFAQATSAFAQAESRFREGLAAPSSSDQNLPRGMVYRSLVNSLEGQEDVEGIARALADWEQHVGSEDDYVKSERARLERQIPELRYRK